jgi:hypothetical protein
MATQIILDRFGVAKTIGDRFRPLRDQGQDRTMLEGESDDGIRHAGVDDTLNGFPE